MTDPPAAPRLWPFWSPRAHTRLDSLLDSDLTGTRTAEPVVELEELTRRVLSPDRRVLACSSGTAALASAYAALGLSPGAEVLVPTMGFRATATPLLALGLVPVLCDAEPGAGGVDLGDAAARVTSRTEALVVTHLWGRPVDLDAARAFADRYRLALVEDCSHAHGARWQGRPVGSVADVAVWSMGTTKPVSGAMLGVLAARDGAVFDRAVVFGQPKHRARRTGGVLAQIAMTGVGHNLRPGVLHAALAADHLSRLEDILQVRNARQAGFEELLAGREGWRSWERAPGHTHGALYKWHAATSDPAAAVAALSRAGMRARRPAAPLHRLPAFADPGLARALLPQARPPVSRGPFPAADALCEELVEFDARDAYDPDHDPLPGYARALNALTFQESR
ncbi:DegT/DnrJ/EryC1/StrS family aminotransferase [Nocardiopsis sp. NPDC006198]|uniref:DegT/DnrJ/EryC1/StrS family aminotransferase n=1 Tax=Nocardiopsis sp. NPDC006198 TaxID=3154472 RepID=UPI0033B48520